MSKPSAEVLDFNYDHFSAFLPVDLGTGGAIGILPITKGGTGLAVVGPAGTVLQSNGPGLLPSWAVVSGGGGFVPHPFDTGNILLTDTLVQPIGVTFAAAHLIAVNLTDAIALLTILDGNGSEYYAQFPLKPRETISHPLGGLPFVNGVQWLADSLNAIRAQLVGD